MKIISIINLKGGVAKTLTADNMAHVLAVFHSKRVLIVDNDKTKQTLSLFTKNTTTQTPQKCSGFIPTTTRAFRTY